MFVGHGPKARQKAFLECLKNKNKLTHSTHIQIKPCLVLLKIVILESFIQQTSNHSKPTFIRMDLVPRCRGE